jgi:hypothetical protein
MMNVYNTKMNKLFIFVRQAAVNVSHVHNLKQYLIFARDLKQWKKKSAGSEF